VIRSESEPFEGEFHNMFEKKVLLALSTILATAQCLAADDSSQAGSPQLAEVVVTAQKRSENLQDVPIPVSVVNTTALADNNQTRLRDYFETVPGFIVTPGVVGSAEQMLTIRGVSSGAYGNPTVGITVDGIPYGSFHGEYSPDIDPSDLARVEVLRGPQGTLYGASSMGGLLSYVTIDPSVARLSGHVEAGLDTVQNGAVPGYHTRGSVNIPVTDTFALRISAFAHEDAGYIDDPVTGAKGVNEIHGAGGRISTLWQISDAFSLKLSALLQHEIADGTPEAMVLPGLGDLQQNYIAGTGGSEHTFQACSAILNGKIGNVDLTSDTGFNKFTDYTNNDYTFLFGPLSRKYFGVSGAPYIYDLYTRRLTEELRATVPLTERLDWMMGFFYSDEHTFHSAYEYAANAVTGQYVGTYNTGIGAFVMQEYAAFTDLTVHVTDQFDVQVGGRESQLHEDVAPSESFTPGVPEAIAASTSSRARVFTYLVTPEYKFSPDFMVYARMASGYRPGSPNSAIASALDPAIPHASDPDKTKNYEVGSKGDVLDHRLSYDVSVYYIDWKDIQISLFSPLARVGYFTNGSSAKSEGVEASLTARPWTGAKATLWGSYDDAVLTESFPAASPVNGVTGNRLPFSAKSSGSLSFTQDFPMVGSVTGFAGATVSYVGDRLGQFLATSARADYPAYTKVDLRAGGHWDDWTLNLYVNNIADKRGVLGGGLGNYPPYAYVYLQPRAVGVSVSRNF
jgi:iron complex outermembrane receptor protein